MTEKTATPKKVKAAAKPRKPRTAPTHPKVADMVDAAIKTLKDRSGSSLQAIKKYIATTYKVDADKLSPFIKKYLKSGVASGGLVQTKGHGASGSFKIGGAGGATKSASKAKKSAAKPKTAKASSPKKAAAKPKKSPQKSKPKKASPAKKAKPVAKAAAKKAKSVKTAAKKKPAKSSPKKKASPKKAKK